MKSTSTLASTLSTNHRSGDSLFGRRQGPAPEVLGVGEEERRVVAVNDQARDGARAGIVVDVVHPGQPGHLAEYRVVRPGHADQQFGDGEPDGDQDPVEDVEGQHADAGYERDHSSRRRKVTSRRSAVTSMSRTAAKITSAPSAATGNLARTAVPEREDGE